MKVSYSRMSSYLSCPQKHYFSYVENLRPKGVVRPLSFGGDFHKLLENRRNSQGLVQVRQEIRETYFNLSSKEQEALGESYLDDLDEVFGDYLDIWTDEDIPEETEHEFLIPVGKFKGEEVLFHGLIDEIYKDGLIGEHKTFNQAPDRGTLAMNMQVCLYAKAYELETGNKITRVQWDYIKSTPADRPIWLEKSGRFSEATSSKITYNSWLRACDEREIDDVEIRNKGLKYLPNISNFFFRVTMEIIPSMVDTVWEDFKATAKDLVVRGHKNKVKNISRDCNWCSYRPLCYAEFTGADVDYVKQREYTIRER